MTDPRPEVVALATALCKKGHPLDPRPTFPCEFHVRRAEETDLPAPFAVVDMDALTERVAQAMSGYGNPTIDWHREARRLLGGGRT